MTRASPAASTPRRAKSCGASGSAASSARRPLYGDGKVYFCGHDGTTTVVKPAREYVELAENKLDDGFMASPAVTGKALIWRTRSAMYRIEE